MSFWDFLIQRKPISPEELEKATVNDVMQSEVVYSSPGEAVTEAIRVMKDGSVNYLVIVDEEMKLAGVLTDGDILFAIYKSKIDPEETTISEIMTKNPMSCSRESTIKNVLEKMVTNRIRRLPVVLEDKKLIGVISVADIEEYAGYSIIMKV